jgi:hypothetical protein
MKRNWLMALLALTASMAAQAEWKVVSPLEANNGKWALYMDDESVQREGQHVRLSILYDLPSDQLILRDKEIRSIRDQIDLDCQKATVASMGSSYSDAPMGSGQVVLTLGAAPAEEILPKTALADIAKRTCPTR